MFESKSRIAHLTETEKDLQDALTRTADRLSKAEKEVVLLSEGGESGARERDRLEDLSIKLQKQVSSLFLSASRSSFVQSSVAWSWPSHAPLYSQQQHQLEFKLTNPEVRRAAAHGRGGSSESNKAR